MPDWRRHGQGIGYGGATAAALSGLQLREARLSAVGGSQQSCSFINLPDHPQHSLARSTHAIALALPLTSNPAALS